MKKKIFVLNKEKIYAYVVSIMTIVTIFFLSSLINSNLKDIELTLSNSIQNDIIGDAIYTSTPFEANSIENKTSNKSNDESNSSDKSIDVQVDYSIKDNTVLENIVK